MGLAQRGARVVVNDLGVARDGTGASLSPAEEVVEEIKAAGHEKVIGVSVLETKVAVHVEGRSRFQPQPKRKPVKDDEDEDDPLEPTGQKRSGT